MRVAPGSIDPRGLRIVLPEPLCPADAYGYAFALGSERINLDPGGFPLDPVARIRDGHAAGPDERAGSAFLETAPADAAIAGAVAPRAALPGPAAPASALRAPLGRINPEDAASERARRAQTGLADGVEALEARTFAVLQPRDFEMARPAFECRECGGGVL